ncbi:unnamed protein product [Chrysoparadoxa australica]
MALRSLTALCHLIYRAWPHLTLMILPSSLPQSQFVNPDAEVIKKADALLVNVAASRGLQQVLRTNLGPRGTLKMLVGGAGQIKLTKDGRVLLHEMQIQHPTATMIARAATAQDDITGRDGTTTSVLVTGELLKQAERYIAEGTHPRVITEGYELAEEHAMKFLDTFKVKSTDDCDRELLTSVARTALRTKLQEDIADKMTEAVTDAVLTIQKPDHDIDLHMVETMSMLHKSATDSKLVKGIVMDHGSRHPDMPRYLENCHIMTCNVSFEYEKSEVASGFLYSSASEREKLVESERKFTDDKVKQVLEFKRAVCKEGESFVIINQKGIDPLSLDMFAKEGIMALRRAKRRNMERLTLSCGGIPINSTEDMGPEMLGWAGKVYEESLGEDKFTFVEDVKNPQSCTILINGPNDYTISQIKDSIRDGLRAVKNTIADHAVVPGAGAFEVALHCSLMKYKDTVKGKTKLGIEAFANAMLVIPKTLAENSGLNMQESVIKLIDERTETGLAIGLDLMTGEIMLPAEEGIWDNYCVKRQSVHLSTVLACQLLLVDEVIRAGKAMGQKPEEDE